MIWTRSGTCQANTLLTQSGLMHTHTHTASIFALPSVRFSFRCLKIALSWPFPFALHLVLAHFAVSARIWTKVFGRRRRRLARVESRDHSFTRQVDFRFRTCFWHCVSRPLAEDANFQLNRVQLAAGNSCCPVGYAICRLDAACSSFQHSLRQMLACFSALFHPIFPLVAGLVLARNETCGRCFSFFDLPAVHTAHVLKDLAVAKWSLQ